MKQKLDFFLEHEIKTMEIETKLIRHTRKILLETKSKASPVCDEVVKQERYNRDD